MKVSGKIFAGFLFLMLLAMLVTLNQLSIIHQMQATNRDLSEINMSAASTALRMQELADVIREDSRKYFATTDPIYDRQISDVRQEMLDGIAILAKSGRSERER